MRKQRVTWLLCSLLVWFLSSCEEEVVWDQNLSVDDFTSYVKTGDLSAIGGNSVTIKGSVTTGTVLGEVQEYGVEYSSSPMEEWADKEEYIKVPGVGEQKDFSVSLTGLNFKTTYYYRTYAKVNDDYYYGKVKNFITLSVDISTIKPADPVVTAAWWNGSFSVSSDLGISGNLDDLNCETGFCWMKVSLPFVTPTLGSVGTESTTGYRQPDQNNAFESSINVWEWQETDDIVYAVRAYFKINVEGTEQIVYSNDVFVAKTDEKQISSLLESVDATEMGVTFQAVAVNFGDENCVEKGFCYSQTNSSPECNEQSGVVKDETSSRKELITASIKGLDPNQYYYVRAYYKNEAGEIAYSPTHIYGAYWATVTLSDPVVEVSETETEFTVAGTWNDSYNVLDNQAYYVGFCWKTVGANYSEPVLGEYGVDSSNAGMDSETSSFSSDIYASEWSNSVDRIYAVRAYLKVTINNEEKVIYSSTSYAVKTTEPVLSPLSVIKVNGDAVTFRTMAFNFESMEITEKGYCYSNARSNPEISTDSKVIADTEGAVIEASITGLDISDNKFYYIRPYYIVDGVTYYGDTQIYGTRLAGIYTLEDLIAFRDARKNNEEDVSWWKNENNEITLYADIDMGAVENWIPISKLYSGEVFNGNGKTLSNLKITALDSGNNYLGFVASNAGTIKDLNIGKGSSITLTYTGNSSLYAGGICAENTGSISGCNSAATLNLVSGSNTNTLYIGGIVGTGSGEIENCSYTGNINGQSVNAYLGGIIGYTNNGCVITDCINEGIIGNGLQCEYIGGIAGYAYKTDIISCSNSGTITGNGTTRAVGGIVGCCEGSYNNEYSLIDKCVNSAVVVGGDEFVGGIVGLLNGGVTNCTHSGKITTSAVNVGAICGQVNRSINLFSENHNEGTVNDVEGAMLIGKDERPPLVGDVTIVSYTSTTAVLSARILDIGGGTLREAGFYYSTRGDSYYDNSVIGVVEGDTITITLESLEPGIKYYIWAFVRNEFSTARSSSSVSFTTHTSNN